MGAVEEPPIPRKELQRRESFWSTLKRGKSKDTEDVEQEEDYECQPDDPPEVHAEKRWEECLLSLQGV